MKKLTFTLILLLTTCFFHQNMQAQTNYVLLFDGVDDYVDLGDSVGDSVRTVEMWFKPLSSITPSLATTQSLIMRSNLGNNIDEFGLCFPQSTWAGAGRLRFHYTDFTQNFHAAYSDQDTWIEGRWYHVAGVIDPVNGMRLYINGILQNVADPTFTKATDPSSDFLGLGVWGNKYDRYFNGEIEDVRLSGIAEYNANFTPPCQHLALGTGKAVYNFNEGSGSVAYDAGPGSFDGIIVGPVYYKDSSCVNPPLANDPLINNEGVKAYPNPFTGEATISVAEDGTSYNFDLYNVLGESVRRITGVRKSTRLNAAGLDPGIYFLRYSSDTGRVGSQRLVIQ
ncbi:MAG: T9SS type A sorting domain-containing protein [Bacteroidia bacterium]|nr:T9SS type A sorting domain-containing protein [Bacteroidia bacterium]